MSVFESHFGDADLDQEAIDDARIALSKVGFIGRIRLFFALMLTAVALRLVPAGLEDLSDLVSLPESDGGE